MDININTPHYNIDFTNININRLTNNIANICSVFFECLYWLNESEIKAHIEDIFTELSKYSKTLSVYYNIDNTLHFFKDSLDDKQNEYIKRRVLPTLQITVNRNRVTLNYIYSKSFTKLKKVYKHISQLCAYIKNN